MTGISLLSGDSAVQLWLKGSKKWNSFIKRNPNLTIDFSSYDFRQLVLRDISFENFKFHCKKVDFTNAEFGSANVKFKGASFKCNEIKFINTKFFGRELDFSNAEFKAETINFQKTYIYQANIKFVNCKFNSNKVIFNHSDFGRGHLTFENSEFSNGELKFDNCIKSAGEINFKRVQFRNILIDFSNSKLESIDKNTSLSFKESTLDESSVIFKGTNLSRRNLSFERAKMSCGNLVLVSANISNSKINLDRIRVENGNINLTNSDLNNSYISSQSGFFGGSFNLSKLKNSFFIRDIDLRFSNFSGGVDFSENKFNFLPNLCHTKLNNHFSLDEFEYSIPKTEKKHLFGLITTHEISDKALIPKIRRFKELAEQNKDHDRAIEFHAIELSSRRWKKNRVLKSLPDLAYSLMSDYGRSIARPVILFILASLSLASLFTVSAYSSVKDRSLDVITTFGCSIELVMSNSLPFLNVAKDLRTHAIEQLFKDSLPYYYGVSMIIYSTLSMTLLFLIGLAIRNRFKL
ncbi:hypothetical protein [Shewanella spartinae]|uniref:hypothetical protein n=1 Tax=Shewanella spartinae TaxID=2864205 RepID=UPI001C66178B|nr:hypothetical protein [Shewanella spartinae]QYJ95067.1 hypothetical protein K0I31_06705 [Shewanella spartinae]